MCLPAFYGCFPLLCIMLIFSLLLCRVGGSLELYKCAVYIGQLASTSAASPPLLGHLSAARQGNCSIIPPIPPPSPPHLKLLCYYELFNNLGGS